MGLKNDFNSNVVCRLMCTEDGIEESRYMDAPCIGDIISLRGNVYVVASVSDNGEIAGFGEYDACVSTPIQCYIVHLKR